MASTPIRLTRRGRVVIFGSLLVLCGLAIALLAPSGNASAPIGDRPIVVVQRDDTLWSIAERVAPGADPYATVEQIRHLNGLDDYTIYAGQELVIPAAH